MSDVPTVESIQKLRVVDLRERLSKLGLPTSGLKADLVERLHSALVQKNEEQEDETKVAEKDEAGGGFEEMQEDTASSQSESSQREEGGSKDVPISKQPKEKSLLDKHKEALALEQVRLLEQEKAIQETVLLQQGQQQHQMLEEQRERQERLEEQKERAMARVQQKMIAREEEEKTMLAHQQHQMLEQQKILEEQQELMHLQQQALIEKTIELGGVPPPVPTSLAFTPVESAIVITPPAPIVTHPPSGVGMVTMAISGPPVNVVPPPPIIANASLAPPVPPVPAPVSMVPAGPSPVSMVSTIASIPSAVSMASSVSPAVSMVPTVAPVPPPVSMVPTSTPLPPPIQTSGPPMSMPMGIAPPPPMPMGGPPQPMSAPPQPPMSLTGPPQPPMPMPGPPQPPMSMPGPPQPPMSMQGPPQPPMSMPGPPQPPMSMSGPPQPPMSMPGPPPPPMSMPGPPQPPMSMGGPPQPPMSMGGPPQPPMPMGGPPQPPMQMGGPPQPPMPMGGPPQPPMSMGGPPQPPMSMPGPPPGGVPPPHMMQGPPSSGPSSMVPPSGPPSMTMGGMPSQHGPPAPNMQGPPPPMMQGPPPPIHGGPPRPMMQGPPTSMLQGSPHSGPMPPHHPGPQHPIHSGPPPMPLGPQPGGMHPGHPQGFHQRPPPPPPPPLPPMHQNMPRGPPMVPPPPRPPTMMGMGNVGAPPPPPVRVRPPARIESREPKEAEDKNEDGAGHIQLPQAIEKALQYKSQRAQQLGLEPDEVSQPGEAPDEDDDDDRNTGENREVRSSLPRKPLVAMDEGEDDDMEDEDQPHVQLKVRESKNVRRKKKKRARKNKLQQEKEQQQPEKVEEVTIGPRNEEVEVLYVADKVESTDPFYYQFLHIFEKFKLKEAEQNKEPELTEEERKERARQEEQALRLAERKKPADIDEKDDDDDEKKEEEKPKLSKRKLKKLNRMSIAELKQKVTRPELVEMHDVTAKDPVLLLHLKAARNSVPVPRHWCFKRKYLQGKRGIEKPPFDLPEFIKRTGIMEMRQALQEKEEQKTMKAKMRERVRPKMGKIDIDYQKLHDAFFKWQIKPRMTIHGDIYYEGKEFETRLKEKKPGDLSDDLRIALGMPIGQNSQKCPPPWLIAMQRYGPPPSYPNLKIPGLNAPIPEGCSFGYHAGGWGKPPVDESGRPLYGDVFGTQLTDLNGAGLEEEIDHSLWGELESESSEESEEESSEEEEKADDETGLVTPAEGLVTPSGLSSVPAGMETPDIIELRKRKIEAEMEGGDTPALYTILPEKQTEKVGGSMMGSTHVYDMSAAIQASRAKVSGAVAAMMPPDGVEVTLDPSELEMDSVAMAARYEQTVREQQSQLAKEDLSDMVAEHAARQKNKRKKQQQDSGKAAKKYKEFKF